MKTIGLIGGMSWESSLLYYQIINQRVKEKIRVGHLTVHKGSVWLLLYVNRPLGVVPQ
jgi:aspartate/glutamate racemase